MKQSSIINNKIISYCKMGIVLVAWDLIHYINEGIPTY